MKRIVITGNAGAGKSTLARIIASRLELPLIGLDPVVWQSGWKKRAPAEKDEMIRELVAGEVWVIDGVSAEVQAHADTVVFLDVPRWRCFIRVMTRNVRFLFRSRPELPPGCPEILIIPTLCRIIWNFPKRVRPRILESVSESQRFFHVRDRSQYAACLEALEMNRCCQTCHPWEDSPPSRQGH